MPKFEVTICRHDTLVVVVESENEKTALEAGQAFIIEAPHQDEFLDSCDNLIAVEAHPAREYAQPSKATQEKLVVTGRERDTIMAALRYWQRCATRGGVPESDIAENGREGDDAALLAGEIDALCERINCGG